MANWCSEPKSCSGNGCLVFTFPGAGGQAGARQGPTVAFSGTGAIWKLTRRTLATTLVRLGDSHEGAFGSQDLEEAHSGRPAKGTVL